MKVRVESALLQGEHRGVEGEHKASPLLWYGFARRCVQGGDARSQGDPRVAPTMVRLRMPGRAGWQRNVSFHSPGHFALCVICQ